MRAAQPLLGLVRQCRDPQGVLRLDVSELVRLDQLLDRELSDRVQHLETRPLRAGPGYEQALVG